ncbi:MAG: spermidine/putrescine ABC transporter permease [Parachlamydia sp.]|nr:MAG: spermidine/putrescine ABC transporter permease [Parachlamydia sp.]
MKRSQVPLIITIGILIFLYLPILILMINSFNESRFGGIWTGFSLKWYMKLFEERAIWNAVKNSLIVGISATMLSTILGSAAAFALYRYKTRFQQFHYALIYSPLVIPDILMGMSLLLFFVLSGISLNLFTIFIAHTTFCISYVAMVVWSKLQNFDFAVIEAAQDLGASWFTIGRRILIPLLMPGIVSGALLAFTMSLDDYIISSFVAGPGSTTLPIYVYSMIKFGSTPLINALSTILLFATFILAWITQELTKGEAV